MVFASIKPLFAVHFRFHFVTITYIYVPFFLLIISPLVTLFDFLSLEGIYLQRNVSATSADL